MNRRGFLRALAVAPVTAPLVVQAFAEPSISREFIVSRRYARNWEIGLGKLPADELHTLNNSSELVDHLAEFDRAAERARQAMRNGLSDIAQSIHDQVDADIAMIEGRDAEHYSGA